ncbi:DUF342 domain-containing protein [Porcipelethomonas sp.]|uniref:DUF342 domain-containing protein n=1 Tax=Porcipelethomonas sp. TaxID=2981675 RepID=UPI003EF4FEA5
MAFDFLKNALFKKNKGFSDEEIDEFVGHLKENNLTFKEDDLKDYEVYEENADNELSETDKVRQEIADRLMISVNSPVKLLWNIFYSESDKDDFFSPVEYIIDPIVETNEKYNKIKAIYSDDAEYESFDDNQNEIIKFIGTVQKESLKITKELLHNYIEKNPEDYMTDMDTTAFEEMLKKYSMFKSCDEFRLAIEKGRNIKENVGTDARIILGISKDKLHGWFFAVPPFNGGSDITEKQIYDALEKEKVVYNINRELIAKIVRKKQYFKLFEVARGEEVINGKDGYVENHYSTENTIDIREDINGNINYKELNNVKNIHSGDVICDIYYPVEGKDGKRIDGKVITCKKGKNPRIPSGKNTSVTEDGTHLVSNIDGELTYQNNVFCVNKLLTIEHDVDNASGNINFAGDVLIKGDVREGFSVEAEGSVTILGTVEGAKIVSKGDLVIKYGMTGGNKGVIKTDGNLSCVFLENCKVYAKGNIKVSQVMYSEVASDETITVSGNKGSVTGGKIIAGKNITANVIGAANNPCLKTEIVLGCTPHMLTKYNSISKSLKDTEEKIKMLNQNINYIESNIETASEERKVMLDKMKIQLKFTNIQKESLSGNLEKLAADIEECTKFCSLKCNEMNPIVNINVGDSTYVVKEPLSVCKIYHKDGNAVLNSASLVENIVF